METLDIFHQIKSEMLNQKYYFQSLIEQACYCGLLSDKELSAVQTDLLLILAEQTDKWCRGESSSIPTEKAQDIMSSILFVIGIQLKLYQNPEQAIDILKSEPLKLIFENGLKLVRRKMSVSRHLQKSILDNLLDTPNVYYRATIADGINGFFKLYRPQFAAHEIHITADYIETNAAKDTLTKFGKGDKTPDPYTPEQVKALMQRVEGTVWEMPVILGGLYGMRRSEILGLRWRNVDLENNTFDVTEQLPFKVPPKTKVIEEMAPPKSNGRKLPITELARPFFLKQLALQEAQKEQAAKDGKPYYDNDLVVAKPDGAPIAASWVSSQFGKLLEDLDMPHIRFHDLRHTAATNMHQLTGDFYTVGEVLGHTLAGIGASLGLSMNFEAVTARYVDVRLERKKEVLDAYHSAVEKAAPEKPKEAEPKKGKRAAKKKRSEIDL